jgi:hypothetical protein
MSMYDRIFSSWSLDACAPTWVSVSSGLPCFMFSTRFTPAARKSA